VKSHLGGQTVLRRQFSTKPHLRIGPKLAATTGLTTLLWVCLTVVPTHWDAVETPS
jgi:hypothetical protein